MSMRESDVDDDCNIDNYDCDEHDDDNDDDDDDDNDDNDDDDDDDDNSFENVYDCTSNYNSNDVNN